MIHTQEEIPAKLHTYDNATVTKSAKSVLQSVRMHLRALRRKQPLNARRNSIINIKSY